MGITLLHSGGAAGMQQKYLVCQGVASLSPVVVVEILGLLGRCCIVCCTLAAYCAAYFSPPLTGSAALLHIFLIISSWVGVCALVCARSGGGWGSSLAEGAAVQQDMCGWWVGPVWKAGGETCVCSLISGHEMPHKCACGTWFEGCGHPPADRVV